jgi:tellurite resistance protein TehA-like permease
MSDAVFPVNTPAPTDVSTAVIAPAANIAPVANIMAAADTGSPQPSKTAARSTPSNPSARVATHLLGRLAAMHPAYFALSMSTGIVAIASRLFGLKELATTLATINIGAYSILWTLLLARIALYPRRVFSDATEHARAPGYFTIVAATGVIGTQLVVFNGALEIARGLWWFCLVLWVVFTYAIFGLLTIRERKPSLAEGINGAWLVAVVATQAVAVLGCALDGSFLAHRDAALFGLMCFWLGGGMLYLWIIGLIFYRYMFFPFSPRDLMPPYWINMGAVAISTLAGALLSRAVVSSPLLQPLQPFILGLTIMFWATATWWIPMLLILGCWRHLMHRVPLSYDPLYWGLVFPLGMYAVCTFRLAEALGASFLIGVARPFVIAATVAWLVTFLGLAGRLLYPVVLALHRRPVRSISVTPCSVPDLARPDRARPAPLPVLEMGSSGGTTP